MKLLIVLAAVLLETVWVSSKALPEDFPTMCSKSEVNFNECQLKNFEIIRPYLMKRGIPELNLPALDPLEIESFDFNYTYNDDIWVKAMIHNLRGWGLEFVQIAKFDFNPHTLEGEFVVMVPSVKMKLHYNATAYIFGNLWKGTGAFKAVGTNIASEIKVSLKPFENNGVEYYAIDKLDINDSIGDLDLNIVSDKASQQPLIDRMMDYYDQDRQKYIKMYKPGHKKIAEGYGRDIINSILAQIPAKELIPE